jgi:hypothetical protein
LAGLGAAATGIENRRRRLVGEEPVGRLQPLEQPLVDRPEQEGCLSDPVGECGPIQVHALAGIDLRLTIQRKMVGIFADQHMGDGRFGRDAAFDEPR